MSVLRARFVDDEQHPCHDQESADALDAVETVTYVAARPTSSATSSRSRASARSWRRRARRPTSRRWSELAEKQPAFAAKVKLLAKRAAEKPAMAAVEKRLTCEGLLGRARRHHQPGIYDDAMRLAVRRFQQKHMIYEANFLRRKTVDALARPLLDNDYDGFVRALRERVVVGGRRSSRTARRSKARNLVDEYTQAWRCEQLGLTDAAAALAFFKRHPADRVQDAARGGQAAAAARLLRDRAWICRSSSIAATSGTTCRSTPTATTSRSRARSTRASRCTPRSSGKQVAAGALAHDHRRLARRAGAATATSTSATRARTSGRA